MVIILNINSNEYFTVNNEIDQNFHLKKLFNHNILTSPLLY